MLGGHDAVFVKPQTGELILTSQENSIVLHPLWLRERALNSDTLDPITKQRKYEHSLFQSDLKVLEAKISDKSKLDIFFSDSFEGHFNLDQIKNEIGWLKDVESPPVLESWTASINLKRINWECLKDPSNLKHMLHNFLKYGFCVMENTPTEKDSLLKLAGKFGYVRHTHWGKLFNVEIKRMPTDTAYTDDALSSHTDNPYREPVPGIQFLHCLENNVSGGLSTLVDGVAIIKQLELEMPEHSKILENVNVRFRYEGPSAILENWGSIIERNHNNIINRIRLSNRLDYVPALDKKTLDYFYAGRKRLNELSNHPTYQIQFPFKKGTLLMMDNYRLLHGRTKYNGAEGVRHLQGCYTDHDGVTSLYRMLSKGSKVTSVPTEL
jgi:gamma-butyrobetaine dioxygenase